MYGEQLFPVAEHLFEVFLVRAVLQPQVEVVEEGVLFGPYVNEAGVQSRHELFHASQIDVPHCERRFPWLVLVFHEVFVLK